MKVIQKSKIKYCVAVCLFVFASALASAQPLTVTGTVNDIQGEPLPGVNIRVQGTTTGTTTDVSGKYSIVAPGEQSVLQYSFIGFTPQDVVVGSQRVVNITLEEDALELDEVVVIGYGSVKKSTVTSAVAKMDAATIENRPFARAENAMQGQLAGVVVRTTTGEPGQDIQIRVRGAASINASSDPLYVVDGIPMNTLMGVNPSDIESIEVLKDAASSAIYGSRGSNGVVIVSTKKGKSGKMSVSLNASYGIQSLEKKMDVMSAEDWMAFNVKYNDAYYLREARTLNANTDAQISDSNEKRMANLNGSMASPNFAAVLDPRWFNYMDESIRSTHPYHLGDPGELDLLDWQDEFYGPAPVKEISMTLSGGTDNTSYMFSGGYYSQDGIAYGTGYDRYSLRTNIETKVNKYISAGLMLAPTFTRRDNGGRANGKDTRAHHVLSSAPVSEPGVGYMTNVEPNQKYFWSGTTSSPIAFMDNIRHDDMLRMMGNAFIRVAPMDGLRVEFSASANYYDLEGMTYTFSKNASTWSQGEGANSSGGHNTEKRWNTLLQGLVNYDKTFGRHTVGLMLGASSEQTNLGFSTNQTFNKPFPNDAIYYTFAENTLTVGNSRVTQSTPNHLASFFGRLTYNFDERYLFSGSLRYDGGSVFGANNKWGLFPALSAGWVISREQFFAGLNLPWWNTLKLRASYGATGNNAIGSTASYPSLTGLSYAGVTGYNANSLGNMNLGWEKTNSTDIAIDLGFLKNRIQLSVDWYTKTTKDLLYEVPSMGASGFTTVWANMGEIHNEGIEVELNTQNYTGEFKWGTSFNLSYNKNKVVSLGEANTPKYYGFDGSNRSNILKVGLPAYSFYMYEAIGVWKTQAEIDEYKKACGVAELIFEDGKVIKPGDLRYTDVDHNGIWTKDDDQVLLGNPIPTITYGLTNQFSYKGFDLSILLTAQTGGKIFGVLGRAIDRPTMNPNSNMMARWENAWWSETEQGDGTVPSPFSNTTGGNVDSRWLYSSNYLRIKNLTLGYKVPIDPKVISHMRVYLSVENLKKWDSYYNGFSPEAANAGTAPAGSNGSMGLDYGGYPIARIVTFGVNVNF